MSNRTNVIAFCSAFAALSLLSGQTVAQSNYVLTSSNTPVRTVAQAAQWQRIVQHQLGVAGIDPVGHKIGPSVAIREGFGPFGLGLNWYPVDIFKQTLCGTLHRFEFYDGLGDEADWNNFIIPSPEFAYLLDDVKPLADPDQLHKCESRGDCLEAEVTPDEHFYENVWFPKSTTESSRDGKSLCTYGPWVWEEAHGNRPEIHPSELYWWKETVPQSEATNATYVLMVLQDDSNRFDRRENYNGSIVQPWSEVPRSAEFRIAFEINPQIEGIRFDIDQVGRNIVTKDDADVRKDADDGRDHALVYNGQVVALAYERQSEEEDDDMGVTFVEVTREASGPLQNLQGYLSIKTKVGINDRGKEGFHVIRVTAKKYLRSEEALLVAPILIPLTTSLSAEKVFLAKPVRDSFRFEIIGGEPRLVSDIQLQNIDAEVISSISGVVALRGGVVALGTELGTRFALPEVALAPIVTELGSPLLTERNEAWSNFVAAAGGPSGADVPLNVRVGLKMFQQLQIVATPFYAPVRLGMPSREDDSPFSEELNEILEERDVEKMQRVFGSARPIKDVSWSFGAKNLTTGEIVSVNIGDAGDNEVGVEFLASDPPKTILQVRFPTNGSNNIYQLDVTVNMLDTFGNKSSTSHTVWSHSLSGDDPESLANSALLVAAHMSGIDSDAFLAASKIDDLTDDESVYGDGFLRCGRKSRLYALGASSGLQFSLGELTRLKKIAELCKRS